MLSIAICDDEEYFRITEKQLILKYMAGKNCECMIDMYESGKELLNLREELNQYHIIFLDVNMDCLLYTSPSPRDKRQSRMPSSA